MKKLAITLNVPYEKGNLIIRTSDRGDLNNLREWKNIHKQYFFYKLDITHAQQEEWFSDYLLRFNDYMFIVDFDGESIGCMGIRLKGDQWDVYNVILGKTEFGGYGLMGRSYQVMLRFAKSQSELPISLQVLKNNPAVWWYEKNGFRTNQDLGDNLFMLHS
jgi:hypothetical protein